MGFETGCDGVDGVVSPPVVTGGTDAVTGVSPSLVLEPTPGVLVLESPDGVPLVSFGPLGEGVVLSPPPGVLPDGLGVVPSPGVLLVSVPGDAVGLVLSPAPVVVSGP